jgi:AraC-like DNA-binding protein
MDAGDLMVYWATRLEADREVLWKGPSAKPFHVALMCVSGSLELFVEGRDRQAGSGGLLIFRSDRIGPLRATLKTQYQWVSFYCPWAAGLPTQPRLTDVALIDSLFQRIERAFGRWGGQDEKTRFWLRALLEAISEDDGADRPRQSPGPEDVVHTVIQEIDAHPEQCWSVEQLARRAGYSQTHFYRTFRRLTGRSPQQYLIDARIGRAQRLLLETDLGIGEIADHLGYRSVYHFSKQFRRRVGLAPSAVRTSSR